MIREIKFRAWNNKIKRWKSADLVKSGCFVSTELKIGDVSMTGPMYGGYEEKSKDLSKWMQYTGLKDKNGVEIYEGDIVQNTMEGFIGVVEFVVGDCGDAEYLIKCSNGFHECICENPIVLGNIYQNKKLLKQL